MTELVRDTAHGRVEGFDDGEGTWCWLGIPYAEPPIGPLRWRAPRNPAPWRDTRPAQAFAPACVQYGRLYGPGANNRYDRTIAATLNQAVGSEDCLYLNVWAPAGSTHDLPVIVFIHGGSNVSGYTADPLYHGARLAREANAIVVTIAYRLGLFGWLRLPQLATGDTDGDTGNFGTLDTLHALRWVKKNVAQFGGDPRNVTLMGQSAGAINAWVLLTAPEARGAGLFHRLVALSGGMSLAANLPAGSFPTLLPEAYYATQGRALLNALLVADGLADDDASATAHVSTMTDAQVADYLRAQSPEALFSTLMSKLAPLGLAGSGPIPEGTVLPLDPIAAVAAGEYEAVPVLAGTTRDEGKLFAAWLALSPVLGGKPGLVVGDAERFHMMADFNPDAPASFDEASVIAPAYLPADAPDTGYDAKTSLLGRIFFGASRDNALNTLHTRQADLWHYAFEWDREPAPWHRVYGAAHLFDVPFVLGNFGPSLIGNVIGGRVNERGRLALSQAMMRALAAFARGGDPNTPALGIAWPRWPETLVFNADDQVMTLTVQGTNSSCP